VNLCDISDKKETKKDVQQVRAFIEKECVEIISRELRLTPGVDEKETYNLFFFPTVMTRYAPPLPSIPLFVWDDVL
jgi:hypothetical protein